MGKVGMIVAVTGGTGFIGKRLVERLLERGDTVRLLTRGEGGGFQSSPLLKVTKCDLLTVSVDELCPMLEGVDVLYHCAGQLKDASGMRALHVGATRKLAEAASGRIGHWAQLSSVGVYGPVQEGEVTEDSAIRPVGEYEITKAESDEVVADAADKGGFGYSMLRPSNVFGASMTNVSLFNMTAMIDRGLFFYIGRPGASANYIHVDNVVEGLLLCATDRRAKGGIYNLSDYRTLEDFTGVIAAELSCHVPRLRVPQTLARLTAMAFGRLPGFPLTPSRVDALVNRSTYPVSRIQKELSYHHVILMEDGLRELVEAYERRSHSGNR